MRTAFAAVLLALAAAAPAAAQAPTPTPTPVPPVPTVTPAPTPVPVRTVADGVSVSGVDLSGQTEEQATQTLKSGLVKAVARPVVLRIGKQRATLATKKIKIKLDAGRTARRALDAAAGSAVAPAITFIRKPIRRFVDRFATRVAIAARDARVHITLRHIYRRKAHAGRALAIKPVNAKIERALADPLRTRYFKPKRIAVKPAVGAKDLRRRYASIITVDKGAFKLRLFRHLHFSRAYGVAVGQPAYPTPEGLFAIQSKQVNPTWTAPNSPWAGEQAGQSFDASDPNNPLKARWMGVNGGVGIHGTGQDYSIGTAASHGCIRMHVSDVIDLFDRVSIGTPVLIG